MALSVDDVARGLVRYAKEPVRFVRDVINATPDPWQEEALQALADGKHVAIRSGNGVGKSALLAWIVIWYLSTRPYPKIPCTAPTLHQFRDVLWSEIAYWLSRSKVKPILTWTAEKVCMAGQEASWFAVARTATDKESLAGFHSPHMLFIVDEASGVEDPIFEAIDGALTTPGALVVMTGNPTRLSGYFYEAFTKHPELWHTIQVSQYDCPRIPRPNIQRLIDSYGEDSNYVRVHVLGQFPRAEQDAFIRRDLVEESVRRYAQFPEGDEVQLGIDVARYGSDDSCIAVRKGNKVIHLESRHGLSNPEVAAWAIELARQYRADTIKVDDTGLGGGATDILNASEAVYELDVSIVPLNFGGAGNEFYANAATVWYATLKDLFFSGDIAIPDNEQLIDELSTRRYTATAQGKTKLESKEDYKKRSKKSPDHADALALCFAPAPTSAWDGSIYDWS